MIRADLFDTVGINCTSIVHHSNWRNKDCHVRDKKLTQEIVRIMGSCMSSNSGDGGVSAQPKSKSKTKAFQGTVSVSCVLVSFFRSKPMLRSKAESQILAHNCFRRSVTLYDD